MPEAVEPGGGAVSGDEGKKRLVWECSDALMAYWSRRRDAGRPGTAGRPAAGAAMGRKGAAGGRGRPRQVGPTCRRPREGEREGALGRGRQSWAARRMGRRRNGPAVEKENEGGEMGHGVGEGGWAGPIN
jgi:hypothetical protein